MNRGPAQDPPPQFFVNAGHPPRLVLVPEKRVWVDQVLFPRGVKVLPLVYERLVEPSERGTLRPRCLSL